MDKTSYLIVALIVFLSTLHAIYRTYQFLKQGKMRLIYIFAHTFHSFKTQSREACQNLFFNCIMSALGIIVGIWSLVYYLHLTTYFEIVLKVINPLVGGLISISIGFFTFYYANKYLKKGEASVYGYKNYLFKSQLNEAYTIFLINCFIGVASILLGLILLLPYINKL